MVPETGIEPVRYFYREILSLLCLPISPPGRWGVHESGGMIPQGFIALKHDLKGDTLRAGE